MEVPGAVTDPNAIASSDVSIVTSQGDVDGHLARPVGDRSRPGVIVVHEAFGLNDHIRDLARRFANTGFDALAPDLYTRTGGPRADDMSDVFAKTLGLSDTGVVADLEATAAHLRSLEGVSGKVGCIGFCSGGRHTLLVALSSTAVDASIDYWGGFVDRASPEDVVTANRPTPLLNLAERLQVPLFVVGGAEDASPSPEVLRDLESRLQAAGCRQV